MIIGLLQEIAALYLIVTLTATSLAKLRRWRATAIALIREAVIPVAVAPAVVITVALLELALSGLMVLGVEPFLTGLSAAIMFISFSGYRLVSMTRTKSLTCACAGTVVVQAATPQAVTAALITSVLQTAMACSWMFTRNSHSLGMFELARIVALAAPFAVLCIGSYRRSPRRSERGESDIHVTQSYSHSSASR